jgi:hypothetical protein
MRWVPRSLTVEHKTDRKAVLKLRERFSYPRLLHQTKPGSIIVNWRQGSPWNGTILNLTGKKIQKVHVRSQSSGTAKDATSQGETVNSNAFIEHLQNSGSIKQVWPHKNPT